METIETPQIINAQEIGFDDLLDEVEKAMLESPDALLSFPLENIFTNGLYLRRVKLNKGTIFTSKLHKTQNPYIIMKGTVLVWETGCKEAGLIHAPYVSVTEPNTRRLVYVVEDSEWMTCHANPENLELEEIEEKLFGVHVNKLLSESLIEKIKLAELESKSLSTTTDKRTIKQIKQ
jgi:hypothetical protein